MFEIKCTTGSSLTLPEMKAFQGNLKKRSAADIDALVASIKEDGLLMPIAVWKNGETNHVLDGHARLEAITKMAIDEPAIITEQIPVIFVESSSESEARVALLQITSQYGHVTRKGLATFTAPIASYSVKAPIMKVVATAVTSTAPKPTATDEVILKLRVKKDVVKRLTEVLTGVDGVSIL